MSKSKFKNIVDKAVQEVAIEFLNTNGRNHSKSLNVLKNNIQREKYFDVDWPQKDVELLFKLRTHMINVKMNFKSFYGDNIFCSVCKLFPETQKHLLECTVLRSQVQIPINVLY